MNSQPIPNLAPVYGVLLAGGASSRLGRDKRLLPGQEGRFWLLERLDLLKAACDDVYVLVEPNTDVYNLDKTVQWLPDVEKYGGPLKALARLPIRRDAWYIVVAVDMPNLTAEVLKALRARTQGASSGALVPASTRTVQPLCAAYHGSVFAYFKAAVARGETSLKRLLRDAPFVVGYLGPESLGIDPDFWEASFFNVNTPSDLEAWQAKH